MPSFSKLREPDEWQGRARRKPLLEVIFATVLGFLSFPIALGFVAIGSPGAVKYALLIGAFFLLVAAYAFVTRVRPTHRERDLAVTEHDGARAMEVRYSGRQFVLLVFLVACMAAVFVLATADYASGVGPGYPVVAVLCAVAAAFCLSLLVLVGLGRIRRGRVVLSEVGIYQEGRAFTSFIPWDSFVGAKAAHNGLVAEVLVVASENAPWEKRRTGWLWKIDKLPPVPMIEIDTSMFDLDRVLVYHLIRYYLQDAQARAELGTAAGLARVRSGAFG